MKERAGRDADVVRALARFLAAAGVGSAITGAIAWMTVRSQIAAEKIVVAGATGRMAGRPVRGPLTAYEEAQAIRQIAMKATGGRTYAELDEADPAAETALHASLLRASLFTSILAFGVAGAQVAVGAVLIAVGAALDRLAGRLPEAR